MEDSKSQRTRWRQKCRQALALHIEEELGLKIEPAHVRLIPQREDGYQWHMLRPERKYLFKKQLSKHSVGAYMILCKEVNLSFRAKLFEQGENHTQGSDCHESTPSMVSKVRDLENSNQKLVIQLRRMQEVVARSGKWREKQKQEYASFVAALTATEKETRRQKSRTRKLLNRAKQLSQMFEMQLA